MVDTTMAGLRGGAIGPDISLYACLRYVAGGSYSDIRFFTGISTASLYRVIWKCIDAINACPELDIRFPTTINERLDEQQETRGADMIPVFTPTNVGFNAQETMLRELAADFEFEDMELTFENAWSMNRDRMAKDVECLGLTRPGSRRSTT